MSVKVISGLGFEVTLVNGVISKQKTRKQLTYKDTFSKTMLLKCYFFQITDFSTSLLFYSSKDLQRRLPYVIRTMCFSFILILPYKNKVATVSRLTNTPRLCTSYCVPPTPNQRPEF